MNIYYIESMGEHELHLEPNSDVDHEMLERLEANCLTKGCGRHAENGKLLHVRIALTPVGFIFKEGGGA